jgi:cyclopropane-fatty-acyl-phospholipid synthase
LDIQGPLIDVFESGDRLLMISFPPSEKLRLARWLWSIPAPKYPRSGIFSGFPRRFTPSAARIRDAVNYYYNHPVDFWKLWLDESLCYSCAYFESPEVSLADAQKSKLDYICRKLRLRRGQRLLDMGCGWGALVMHDPRQTMALRLLDSPSARIRRKLRASAFAPRVWQANAASKSKIFLSFAPRNL